jgi:hypothetical protein
MGINPKNMEKTTAQVIIEDLSKQRYEYLNQKEDTWDEDAGKYLYEPKEIDQLADQILEIIKKERNNLPFEFIIEELTKLGDAPCLLYDDNGYFAISGSGFCSINPEPADWEGVFTIEEKEWKPSIREALDYYLDYDEN